MFTFVPTSTWISSRQTSLPQHTLNTTRNRTSDTKLNQQRVQPTMASAISVGSEIIAAGAVSAAFYYFVLREEPTKQDTTEKEEPTTTSSQGIIGLSASTLDSSKHQTRDKQQIKSTPTIQFDSVGVNIEDYLDSDDALTTQREKRLQEELEWTVTSLQDLEACDAVIIADTKNNVVWESGDLISDTTKIEDAVKRLSTFNTIQTIDLTKPDTNTNDFQFLKQDTKTVITVPIGTKGAILILGSKENSFFSDIEQRVTAALCTRLSSFLSSSATTE